MEWLGYPVSNSYKDLDISALPLNHAWVIVNTTLNDVGVFSVRDDCFNCPYKLERHLKPNQLEAWQVDVGHQTSWRIKTTDLAVDTLKLSNKRGWLCQMRPIFKEYGVYRLDIGTCQIRPEVQPIRTYYPLILFSLVLLGICGIYTGINFMWSRKRKGKVGADVNKEKIAQADDEGEETPSTTIDVYRGVLLSFIIFFTTGGGGYPIFTNDWGGLTVAECMFFAYIWSIGVKIPTVMQNAIKDHTKCAVIRNIFIRSFFLIILGTAIDSTVEDQHSKLRLWCPLQKIGIAYFIVAVAYLLTAQKFEMKSKMIICKAITNVVNLLWCWIIAGFLLSLFSILISTFISFNCLAHLRIQDTRADDLKIIEEGQSQNCNNHATEYANAIFIGESQIMINANLYLGFSRGVMGMMSAILYMIIGLKAGVVYLNYKTNADRLKLWSFWATLFGIGGVCFAVVSYPLNFNLWPISSILIVSTVAAYLFSLVYLVTDVWKFTSYLLSSLGVTSLIILSGHMLFSNTLPFTWGIYFRNHLLYMLQNIWVVFLWLIVAVLLKKRNVKFDV